MEEEWKDIPEYEGLYQVSNLGRVKSLCYQGKKRDMTLKAGVLSKGYLGVVLSKDGVRKNRSIHRLVAEAFIPNPCGLPCINHKDECKTNNTVTNLEWCDYKYNNHYGSRMDKVSKVQLNRKDLSRQVKQIDSTGTVVGVFPSLKEAERHTGIYNARISECCRGKVSSAGGFMWEYA